MQPYLIRFSQDIQRPAKALLLAIGLLGGSSMVIAEDTQLILPGVVSAKVPVYPALAKLQKAQGIVRLRVSTDGHKAVKVEAMEGHPALVKAAKANIETWEFQPHKPIEFETVFEFSVKFLPPCEPNNEKYDVVTLRLPARVEIKATMQGECDPVIEKSK